MIPLPPKDRALPGLDRALSEDGVSGVLEARLTDRQDRLFVESSRPRYVRYKPGTNCLVQYEVAVREHPSGATRNTLAHVRLYADESAERIWSSRSYERLLTRAAHLHPDLVTGTALIRELRGVLELYPVDRELRALVRATSSERLQQALAEAALPSAPRKLELVRYKPGRKALLRFELDSDGARRAYAKVSTSPTTRSTLELARAFRAAGIAAPGPLAWLPLLAAAVFDESPGARLADLRGSESYLEWMDSTAGVLARLHTLEATVPGLAAEDEGARIRSSAAAIGVLLPKLADESGRLGEQLSASIAAREPLAVVHGDFYDDQLLVSDEVVLIDLDQARLADPLLDAGNFAAHLTSDSTDAAAEAREAFLAAYFRRRRHRRRDALLFEAAALLKLAVEPFRRLEQDWPGEVERRVRLARSRFKEYRRGTPTLPRRGSRGRPRVHDPSMPQLEALQDRAFMAHELRRHLGNDAAALQDIGVVRHKPGRRCTFVYEVRLGSPGDRRCALRLYGKTFASERGALVHEVLRRITATRSWGPRVLLPDPVVYVPSLKLLLQRAVPGNPVADALVTGDARLAASIAQALYTFHASGVELGRSHSLEKEVLPLNPRVDLLVASIPALGDPARRALALVREGSREQWPWRWQPAHRDFYYEQVLHGEHGISVLDFDDAAMSEPAVDVANFLAHLRLLGVKERGEPDGLASVASAFLERYRALDEQLDPRLVSFLEGATVLRLAHIYAVKPRGRRLAHHLLGESEQLLAAAA